MKSHLGVLETQETQAALLAGMEYLVSALRIVLHSYISHTDYASECSTDLFISLADLGADAFARGGVLGGAEYRDGEPSNISSTVIVADGRYANHSRALCDDWVHARPTVAWECGVWGRLLSRCGFVRWLADGLLVRHCLV